MPSFEQVKATILDVAGNPASGVIADYADAWAAAIIAIDDEIPYGNRVEQDGTKFERPKKETRVTKPAETR